MLLCLKIELISFNKEKPLKKLTEVFSITHASVNSRKHSNRSDYPYDGQRPQNYVKFIRSGSSLSPLRLA